MVLEKTGDTAAGHVCKMKGLNERPRQMLVSVWATLQFECNGVTEEQARLYHLAQMWRLKLECIVGFISRLGSEFAKGTHFTCMPGIADSKSDFQVADLPVLLKLDLKSEPDPCGIPPVHGGFDGRLRSMSLQGNPMSVGLSHSPHLRSECPHQNTICTHL